MTASWPLQQALYAHLAADAGLTAELGAPPRLHDDPPPGAALPYLVLGETRLGPLAGHDGATEHDIRIRIVSRHGGRREVKRLIDALAAAIDGADFPVAGSRLVSCALVSAEAFRRDGEIYAGMVRARIVTEESEQ